MRLLRLVGAGSPVLFIGACLFLKSPAGLAAQSLTAGSLRGIVQTPEGEPVAAASVTLERGNGVTVRELKTGRDGIFQVPLLSAGEYRALVEQVGFQPVRQLGILVVAGRLTNVVILLERRPPPIAAVTEVTRPVVSRGTTHARVIGPLELYGFDRRHDLADASRGISEVVSPFDGREGFALSASGLPATMSRFMVDGVLESFARHPAARDEPARTPVFQRDGIDQAQVMGVPVDAEWRGVSGSLLAAQTRRGTNQMVFRPYATFSSAKLGGRSLDNPGDSTASSFQVGASISGPLVPDTAHFFLRFDYQQLEQPGANPWERDSATYRSQAVSLLEALPSIATDSFGTSIRPFIAPTIRSYKGGSGFGGVDWQVAGNTSVTARGGYASWKERGFSLGSDLGSGGGTGVDGRDISAAIGLTTVGEVDANELRVGYNSARRDWSGPSIASTLIVANGAAFGSSPAVPGVFDRKVVDLADAYQRRLGPHRLKAGVNLTFTNHSQAYRYGSAGVFQFGDLEGYGAGRGSFFQVGGPSERAQFTSNETGFFLQDTWSVSPEIQLMAAMRFDTEFLPKNKILLNTDWQALSGIRNDSIPRDKRGWSPRIGFVWDVQNRGDWLVTGGGGIYKGVMDPAIFAEAILFDRDAEVRRGIGTFASWPVAPDPTLAPSAGQRLTVINSTYRAPKTAKVEFGIARRLTAATFQLTGTYHHTDYLLQRVDLNRVPTALAETQEGRPVYGALVHRGGMILPGIGSNRRFADFDLVSGISPTGSVDHYELTALLERQLGRRVTALASYTYSKTTDNMVGFRSVDPADQLSPFPDGLEGADWTRGRSDFDVPHRGAVTLRFENQSSTPIVLAGRYRVRSGLPFTPGFRPGVDVNGDGSGGNDPAFLSSTIPGLDQAYAQASCSGSVSSVFAARNSCREKIQQSLDLHLGVGLPVGGKRDRLFLEVDAFNVFSTETGLVDRALVLVDPSGTLTSSSGHVQLPLIANPKFGTLLVRRGEPRAIRVGLRMEY
jgi:hypothetical protein